MKLKLYCCCLLTGLLLLTGCTRSFDSASYVTAMLDTLYKGDYTDYAAMTGITTAEASLYREQWLADMTDDFIAAMGSGTPSDETALRVTELLKKIYANARYEAAAGGTDSSALSLTVSPIRLMSDSYEALQAYVTDFNTQNEAYAYASLTTQAYYDTYLDGILDILESRLANIAYDDSVTLEIALIQDDAALYTIDPRSLADIQALILSWPAAPQ